MIMTLPCEKKNVKRMTLVFKKMPHPHCVSNGDVRRNTAAVHFLWEKDIKPQKDWNIMKFKQRSQKINPERGKTCF